jgi:flagellar hook-length control protein FliK
VAASTVAPAIQSLDVRVDGAPTPNTPVANAPPKATLENLPQQVIRGLRYLVESGEHTLRIRLVPESLGEVNLEVRSSRDEVSVRMASASPIVREVLQQHLPSLRESLAQDGVHVAKVSVSVDLNQSHAPSEGGRHGFSQSYAHRGPTPQLTHPAPKPETSVTQSRAASHTGALNVYV